MRLSLKLVKLPLELDPRELNFARDFHLWPIETQSQMKELRLATERLWLTLARRYGFSESLEDFTAANSERRGKFPKWLRQRPGLCDMTHKDKHNPKHKHDDKGMMADYVMGVRLSMLNNHDDVVRLRDKIITLTDELVAMYQPLAREFGYEVKLSITRDSDGVYHAGTYFGESTKPTGPAQ